MARSHLTCPNCKSSLKTNKAPPVGVDILCPKCKTFFKVSSSTISAAAPAVAAKNGNAGASPYAASANGGRPRAVFSPEQPSQPAAPPATQSLLRTGVFVGVGVAGLALALLIAWLMWGGEPSSNTNNNKNNDDKQGLAKGPSDAPLNIDFGAGTKKSGPPTAAVDPYGLSDDERQAVAAMKSKGVDYLRKLQKPDGSWPSAGLNQFLLQHYGAWDRELAAMCGLVLLEAGIKPDDPQIKKAADLVRQEAPRMIKTYGVSLYILFLDKLNDARDKPLLKRLALRLIAGQLPHGTYDYNIPVLNDKDERDLLTWLQELAKNKKDWREFSKANPDRAKELPAALKNLAVFRLNKDESPEFFKSRGGDHSNTQFALLAMLAVRKQVPVDLSLGLIVKRFQANQMPDGHWLYSQDLTEPFRNAPMTCAGLLGLALGYGLDGPKAAANPLNDPSIQKGLAYLSNAIPPFNPDPKHSPKRIEIYTLWSIERVGVLFKLPKIGDKEWYRWGLQMLRKNQGDDGGWNFDQEGLSPVTDTCFAMLFLQQANLAKGLSDKLEEMTGLASNSPPALRKE